MINKNRGYTKNTIDFFNKMAEKNHGDSYKHYKTVISWIDFQNEKIILDLGCGKGELLETIKMENINLELFGVDISPNMIEKAKTGDSEINFQVGSSEKIDFSDNFFQMMTCLNSFHHYENPKKSLKEMYRVLTPQGKVIIGEIYIPEVFRGLVNRTLPYGNTGDFRIYSSQEIKKLFSEAGFRFVKEKFIFPSLKLYMFEK